VSDIDALLGLSAFRTIRATIRRWRDTSTYVRALEKYRSHRPVAEVLDSWSGWVRQEENWPWLWRVWVKRPRWIRVEESTDGGATWDTHGGDGATTWQLFRGELHAEEDRSIAVLTAEGSASIHGPTAHELLDRLDIVHTHAHPLVAELIDPLDHLPKDLRWERGGPTTFLGRRAMAFRAWVADWDRWNLFTENLTVADDYEVLVDVETGVILRFAQRFEGREYGATEMTEVAFDEDLPAELFQPPQR
jgi:hypothetical protein